MTPEIIRAWAKAQGMEIGDRGRVSQSIREAWEQHAGVQTAIVVPAKPKAVRAPRKPKAPKARPEIRAEEMRAPGPVILTKGDPIKIKDEQGNWRFLAFVVQSSGLVYVDCVDPGGIGRAISPDRLLPPGKGVTAIDVRPTLDERQASATAHTPRRSNG